MGNLINTHPVVKFRKPIAIIAVVLVICLCCIVALFGFIVDFSSDGGMHGGGVIFNCPSFAPHIYNKSTVDISMGYTPAARAFTPLEVKRSQ